MQREGMGRKDETDKDKLCREIWSNKKRERGGEIDR